MSYYQKYLKYKSKYLRLSNKQYDFNNQQGGAITIQNEEINMDITKLTSMLMINTYTFFIDNVDTKSQVLLTPENIEVQTEKIKYLYNPETKIITSLINMASTGNIYASEIDLINKTKTFIIKKLIAIQNVELVIVTNYETGLNPENYIETITPANFSFKINYNDKEDIFEGTVTITKKPKNCDLKFTINRINGIDYFIELDEVDNAKFFLLKEFNFQESYDSLKEKNNLCIQSTILNKHLYNTLYTNESLNNIDIFNVLNRYGDMLENILLKKYRENGNIRNICSNQDDRQLILNNVMKRINTTFTDNFLIKQSTGDFISLETINAGRDNQNKYKIIFDTGNSFLTIIGINLVKQLNLQQKHMFFSKYTGATGDSSSNNTYVDIELKLDPRNTNISLKADKIYKFKAIVNSNSLKDTLLLGQSAEGLKSFFDGSYCIGFNDLRQKHDADWSSINNDLNMYVNHLFEVLSLLVHIILLSKYGDFFDFQKLSELTKRFVLKIFKEAQDNRIIFNVTKPNYEIEDLLRVLPILEENIDNLNLNTNNDNKEFMIKLDHESFSEYYLPLIKALSNLFIRKEFIGEINLLLDQSKTLKINSMIDIPASRELLMKSRIPYTMNIKADNTFSLNSNGFFILVLRILSLYNIFTKLKHPMFGLNPLLLQDQIPTLVNELKLLIKK